MDRLFFQILGYPVKCMSFSFVYPNFGFPFFYFYNEYLSMIRIGAVFNFESHVKRTVVSHNTRMNLRGCVGETPDIETAIIYNTSYDGLNYESSVLNKPNILFMFLIQVNFISFFSPPPPHDCYRGKRWHVILS